MSGTGITAGICTERTRYFTVVPTSDFLNWFYVELVGLVCVKGNEGNGRREQTNVVSASKYGRIIAGDVESPPLLSLLLLLLLLLLLGNSHTSPCANCRLTRRLNHRHAFCSRLDVNNLWHRRWRK